MEAAGHALTSIDAVAVSNGPGSYTGLRVGLSTAKGIAYALDKPLILVNTLVVIAAAAIRNVMTMSSNALAPLFCPMIDARRMEVFTAVYDRELKEILAPCPMILNESSFDKLLQQHSIVFTGSGSEKFKTVIENNNAIFLNIQHDAGHMSTISEKLYLLKSFADKAYSEPYYLKEFFTPAGKLKSD
jgi:tRNA threonylcarbamoyladenosine biosynthesis protein TsaB